jgi:heat shock protein HslJ
MNKVLAFLIVPILLVSLAGCAKTVPVTVPPSPETTTSVDRATLSDTTWVLKSYGNVTNMTPVLHYPGNVTLTFNSALDRWSGNDGVNSFGGACRIENNSVAASEMTQTLVLASDPVVQKQADTYESIIQKAKSFSIKNNELVIYCSNGQALQFVKSAKTTN